MSGHSKWSTIKRKKGINDQARGKLFSKLVKAITIAVKEGGGSDPDMNPRLRVAIDAAKTANMPGANIDRAVTKASSDSTNIEEITYEGFGPSGVGILIEAATDNKNRTAQEIKYALERGGGNLGSPGSVSFNFAAKGYLRVEGDGNIDEQMLKMIDAGVEDMEESDGGIDIYVSPNSLLDTKKKLESIGFSVASVEFIKDPASMVPVDEKISPKVIKLIDTLDSLDDVVKVYTNADIN